jgi:glycosyltransferase involved in cell wall biosynthesis
VAADLVRESSRVISLRHTNNKGHIETYNEGIEWASGDYFLLLSADDYLLPGTLHRAADLMDAHLEVGFTFGKAIDLKEFVTGTETVANTAVANVIENGTWSVLSGEDFFTLIESVRSMNAVRSPTAVVRTELQKRLGGYRRELPHTGDLEMWLRLAAHAPVGVLAAYQAVYRLHSNNMETAYYRKYLPDLQQ